MSFIAAAWAIAQEVTVTPSQKLVLIALADCHNAETGRCDPSHEHVGRIALLKRRQVINVLADLERLGLITVTRRAEHGIKVTNEYRLNISAEWLAERMQAGAPDVQSRCATECTSDVQSATSTMCNPDVQPIAHKPGTTNQEEENLEEEDARARDPVVRVGAGWLITEDWKPSDAAIAQARMAGVPHSLIVDEFITSEFRLKYREAPQRDPAFDKRWVRWLINEARSPRTIVPAARDPTVDPFEELRRRAAAEEADRVGAGA